ncbi:transcription antitermination regulator [Actinoplanes sp. SE50]|uniref:GAF and ANTAR domain-containing protein n=1 Tax=unclassified Actinoplanes TaxID=2626549 RepID=UPI00023ED19F|nr:MULTISPECIES: GAF and ANTAR domain-containing protein [unclassified Actinoplanes]AEV82172.1 ANTAR domain protein with unknown sensor [Actinoplanes sp. SE50/110]ATO80571.1 transcription antitermination regulator [Actinoplanes sp. SE50]SLL97977.1 transcription antitermination regulator [Actinoplanes sp. SE50/110]
MSVPQRRVPAAQRGIRNRRRATLGGGTPPGQARRLVAGRRPRHTSTAAAAAPHPVELAGLLHEVSVRLLTADTVRSALDRLAGLTVAALPGAVRCSVALISEGGPITVAAAGSAGETSDARQYADGSGPGLEAARTRTLVTSEDLGADDRWPELSGPARADGIVAVASVPLDVRRHAVGALTVGLGAPGPVAPEVLLTVMAVAGQAEVLIGELHRREALTEGAAVDRAVGVIIAQRGCGVQEAYRILHDSAQRLGLDRVTVAERLVAAAARDRDQS